MSSRFWRNHIGGYTLIEVMLFLAISTIILAISIVAVQGQQQKTAFRTTVDDLNSKFQQWIDQVANGESGNTSDVSAPTYSCTTKIIGGVTYPYLTNAAPAERGTNQDCIFMGKAILLSNASPEDVRIMAVPIVGLRTDSAGGPVTSISAAHPIAALPGAVAGNPSTQVSEVDLSETYTFPPGTHIAGVRDNGSSLCNQSPFKVGGVYTDCTLLVGFFTSFNAQSSSQQNGSQSILAVQYPMQAPVTNYSTWNGNCISLSGSECSLASYGFPDPSNSNLIEKWPLNNWEVCVNAGVNSDRWAILSVNSSNGIGASTSIKYAAGSLGSCPW